MGILYLMSIEVKRQHIIKELLEKGVTENKQGVPIYDLDYEELKSELVLQAFRELFTIIAEDCPLSYKYRAAFELQGRRENEKSRLVSRYKNKATFSDKTYRISGGGL